MTSVESIGSCSLDFDASDPAENFRSRCLTASEFTLQSAKLVASLNGSTKSENHKSPSRTEDKRFRTELIVNNVSEKKPHMTNGHTKESKMECATAEMKLPSYVSISCAINGYANYSQFCRSRDNSPARPLRKSSLETPHSQQANTQGRFLNSTENAYSVPVVRCSRSYSDCNGNSRTVFTESRHVDVSKQLQIPLESPEKYTTEIVINKRHSAEIVHNLSAHKFLLNGHLNEKFLLAKEVGNGTTKSLVQQRIESLYGVSAEEKAKLPSRISRLNNNINQTNRNIGSSAKRSPSCPPEILKSQLDSNLPVFRHLRKDFREQLLLEDSTTAKSMPPILITRFGSKPRHILPKSKVEDDAALKNVSIVETNGFHSLPSNIEVDECDRSAVQTETVSNVILNVTKPSAVQSEFKSPCLDRDGKAFLEVMDTVAQEIKSGIQNCEKELEENIPEEASGKIRAACGKANLLLSQKFEQFRGLCMKNIEESPDVPFYTTASDLEGFWDMVMLQVKDVKETFKEIHAMKENNWQEVKQISVLPAKTRKSIGPISKSNPSTPKRAPKSAELARAREEARKQLIAAKRKGRQQNTNLSDTDVSIFTQDAPS